MGNPPFRRNLNRTDLLLESGLRKGNNPPSWRAGVAQALLERMIAEAREAGYQTMFADTLPTMQTALDFYARAGFVACGPYASDPTPGAVYLRRNL